MEETWSVPDVYLLTEGSEGTVAVPDLTLTFLGTGVALDKADGEHVWSSPWDQLEAMAPVERSELPDGRSGIVIVVVERAGRREHRFVLAADEPAETEADVRHLAASHGLQTKRPATKPAVSKALTTLIVLAALATMAALLLSAAHVIHF
jgi:hypothetical protein